MKINTVTLNDGVQIPVYGFGTFQIPADGSTYKAVREALDLGIRHIDTAAAYFNESEVGQAINDSGIDRKEIFVTSKLWLQDYGYEAAKKGIETSLRKLGLDYMDLYLIHQPYGDVPGAWKAMEEAKAAGKIRSIGVSNMTPKIWNEFVPQFNTVPSVNQVEFHPFYQQKELREILDAANVRLEAWAPLGQGNPDLLNNPVISKIAEAHGKENGQIILRFEVQEGIIIFPKTTNPKRMKSNMEIFDFELTEDEMNAMRALDTGKGRHNPDAPGVAEFLLANYDIHADEK
ncbi:MAG: aldo/keto reductase [Veillonella sp.]|uniref:aldo/keto reductase n=1 Tax=Veillonella sp. TaxID=1926307 RepID=UPI0025F2B847|nr:aldo/keto reductase [Veillonella sp.]MBS4914185.1 aldo/keto reductase [Veillonella sp.]